MKIKKEHRNLIIAMSIGDGHISKSGRLVIQHSTKQEEYIKYKYKLLNNIYTSSYYKSVDTNGFEYIRISTKVTDFLKVMRRVLYPDNKKTLNRKILNRIDLQGLAIWWMDDGTKGIKYNKDRTRIKACIYRLCLCSTREQCQLVIDWLRETYDISFGITKEKNNFSITCGTKVGRQFSDLIRPYIIPSMLYKIA